MRVFQALKLSAHERAVCELIVVHALKDAVLGLRGTRATSPPLGSMTVAGLVHRAHRREQRRLSPDATAPSIAAPRSTASGSSASTTRHPVASACSRKKTGFFVSPPQAMIVSIR